MSKFVDAVLNTIRPYQTKILIFIMLILFIIVGYYTYNKYGKPTLEQSVFKDTANAVRRTQSAVIKIYWVDWCPYCKSACTDNTESATGPWPDFKKAFDGQMVGTHKLNCELVNCTASADDNSPVSHNAQSEISQYDIKSFPTIKLIADGKVIDFDAKISKESLEQFVNSVL